MEYHQNTLKRTIEDGVDNKLFTTSSDEHSKGSMVKVVRFSLRGKKWTYRGEGNANVVIALPQELKIIRLRKCNASGLYSPGESATFSLEGKFCSVVMIPLFGACYVNPPTIISIDGLEILELETQLAHQRPVARLHKSIQAFDAALYMDFTHLPVTLSNESSRSRRFSTYCVEIKPKQGWVPKADRQLHKCKYCLQQYYKVMTRRVKSISQYCPLDLFSGNLWRMKKALCALLDTPQNNLKIFKDGNVVYDEGSNGSVLPILKDWLGGPTNIYDSKKLFDKFCFVIMEALARDMGESESSYGIIQQSIHSCDKFLEGENGCSIGEVKGSCLPLFVEPNLSSEEDGIVDFVDVSIQRVPHDLLRTAERIAFRALKTGKEYSCNWNCDDEDQIPKNCVLQRILNVQKLDTNGADYTYKAYRHEENLMGTLSNFSYIPSLLDTGCVLSPIHRYLLAATAKDCSIMLTFREESDSRCTPKLRCHTLQCPDGQMFIFNVGVIDLEPKPISCIEKHARRDCDIYSAYVNWHIYGGQRT